MRRSSLALRERPYSRKAAWAIAAVAVALTSGATVTFAGKTVGLVVAGSSMAVVIAYTIRFLAIAIGFMQAGYARISPDFDDMARILGARPVAVVRTIHLPLVRPAIWGAALLVFIDCLKELPATLLLRPMNTETLSTYIYQYASRGNFEQGSLAALMKRPMVCRLPS